MFVRNRRWIWMVISISMVALSVAGWWTVTVQGEAPIKSEKEHRHFQISSTHPKMNQYPFQIKAIDTKQDFYRLMKPAPLKPLKTEFDQYGIPMYQKEDGTDNTLYNHPVRLAHNIINFITSYKMTNDKRYLTEAKKYAQRLSDIAVEQDGAIFFPYDFAINLHDLPTEQMKPRWYSGMAQGQALSAFVRLYQITHDTNYLKLADKTYLSLRQLKSKKHPIWVSMIDQQGYFWMEEYPMEKPSHILNGFIFSIFGLYDYYQVSKQEEVKEFIQASITTVYDNIERYRVPDDASYYGLKLDHQSKHYHHVHTDQLETLFHITGDSYFHEMSQTFHHDWYGWPAKIKRQVKKVKAIFK
jgi:hypothetical protein